MEKEEKALEAILDALISRAQDLRNSITSFIIKLETEYEVFNWPTVLDNFAMLSGQVNTMLKILKNEKTPILRNRVLFPLVLSPDRDEELARLTENRVPSFNHEVVPDYLRTKPDPEVEAREMQFSAKANTMPVEAAHKQVTAMNKIVVNILDMIKSSRDTWESESGQRATAAQTTSSADTGALIAAICLGKGLRPQLGSPKGQPANQQPPPQQPSRPASGGKVPSSIKTNIKSASSMHPYGR